MTFTDLFKNLGLEDSYFGQLGYIFDAPNEMFNLVKDNMAAALEQDLSPTELLKEVSNNEEIDIAELKKEMAEMYEALEESYNDGTFEGLPKDRLDFLMELVAIIKDKCLALPERKVVEIIYEKLDNDVILPSYAHSFDAGADIHANEEVEIQGNTTALVKTGFKVDIPIGWELQIRPRSGMSLKTPIRIANAPGTIDSGFKDEVCVICQNTSPYPYTIHKGDRIAQIVPKISPMIIWKEGKVEQEQNNRGGFGSTGI